MILFLPCLWEEDDGELFDPLLDAELDDDDEEPKVTDETSGIPREAIHPTGSMFGLGRRVFDDHVTRSLWNACGLLDVIVE